LYVKGFLAAARRRALRKGVWFTALDSLERGILTLTSRVVDEVRNTALNVEIVKILAKLRNACMSRFARHVESFGAQRARQVRDQALSLGGRLAEAWVSDWGFPVYLAFLDLNQPPGWGSR
jgi:hypothetical protein